MEKYLYEDLYNLEEQHWWHVSKRRVIKDQIKKYITYENPKILDVGCGTGKNMEGLLKLGKVWGLDNSLEAINYCKKRGLKNLKLGDAQKTNFESRSFDVITLLDILEHTDDNKTLKEMCRIIKKNGLLIATVPAFTWLWSEWDKVLHHKRRYNKKKLERVLKKNNFQVIRITYLYSFLVIPIYLIRKIKRKLFYKQDYPSDFRLNQPILNWAMSILSTLEFKITEKITIPFGTTVLVIAKQNGR